MFYKFELEKLTPSSKYSLVINFENKYTPPSSTSLMPW